jgi:hypothetical protein
MLHVLQGYTTEISRIGNMPVGHAIKNMISRMELEVMKKYQKPFQVRNILCIENAANTIQTGGISIKRANVVQDMLLGGLYEEGCRFLYALIVINAGL